MPSPDESRSRPAPSIRARFCADRAKQARPEEIVPRRSAPRRLAPRRSAPALVGRARARRACRRRLGDRRARHRAASRRPLSARDGDRTLSHRHARNRRDQAPSRKRAPRRVTARHAFSSSASATAPARSRRDHARPGRVDRAAPCATADKAARLAGEGIAAPVFDGDAARRRHCRRRLPTATHLLVSIAPGEDGDRVLAPSSRRHPRRAESRLDRLSVDRRRLWRLRRRLGRRARPRRTRPVAPRSGLKPRKPGRRWHRERERAARRSSASPASMDRAATRFVNLAEGKARRIVKPGQVFNRIHVADIAASSRRRPTRKSADGHLQPRRRRAGAAAGCRRLCRELMGVRAAARNSLRAGRTFADGAELLWREQAGLESADQGRARRRAPLSDLSRGSDRDVEGRELAPSAVE